MFLVVDLQTLYRQYADINVVMMHHVLPEDGVLTPKHVGAM